MGIFRKKLDPQEPFKKNEVVTALVDLPGVPAGTQGKVKMSNGITWSRYWVFFNNGIQVGQIDSSLLARPEHREVVEEKLEERKDYRSELRTKHDDQQEALLEVFFDPDATANPDGTTSLRDGPPPEATADVPADPKAIEASSASDAGTDSAGDVSGASDAGSASGSDNAGGANDTGGADSASATDEVASPEPAEPTPEAPQETPTPATPEPAADPEPEPATSKGSALVEVPEHLLERAADARSRLSD